MTPNSSRERTTGSAQPRPVHPFWCDECGAKAPFTIKGCDIPHDSDCHRRGEDAMGVWEAAVDWCKATGESIP
jgi:hypothetical protein